MLALRTSLGGSGVAVRNVRCLHTKSRPIKQTTTTQLFLTTLRSAPADAVAASHALLVRAGFIRQTSAGIYTLMPMALRALEKVKAIIADELDRIGGAQVALPTLHPASLWEQSGRLQTAGPELFRLQDRKHGQFCLGPTHEEVITDMVAKELNSYRQLPIMIYQMDRKFRDEMRPRFGLLRGREFWMKDLYSFDETEQAAHSTYDAMCSAYERILTRMGLDYARAEADTGNIGGTRSHEFHVLSQVGEDTLIHCRSCGYAANQEKAVTAIPENKNTDNHTPHETAAALLQALGLSSTDGASVSAYWKNGSSDSPVLVAMRRGQQVNEIKVLRAIGAEFLSAAKATDEVLQAISSKPQSLQVLIDDSVSTITIDGALKGDYRTAQPQDPCKHCNEPVEAQKGIEVGHTFYLGRKYSTAFNCTFRGRDDKMHTAEMGCYGLGLTRILAAVVENHHDSKGIKWPLSVAPYAMTIVPLGSQKQGTAEQYLQAARDLHDRLVGQLPNLANEIVIDDRLALAPGAKLKDAQLVGYPITVVVGQNAIEKGMVEIETRADGKKTTLPFEDAVNFLKPYTSA
eukprot:comp22482_c0_seq1/m.33905 comp22482_c0_seq1/g.33905  ORF comp22482_c0_seq1/g.33905 comp22482_c0_seq1/m.33905 type:complete len:574 (-) comp22482_c0_seq1:741-2462(-)